MSAVSAPAGARGPNDGPAPELRFRRRVGMRASLRQLWRARPLIRSLAERDLRARYKQSLLGVAWAVVPPLGTVIVFTVLFDRVADIDSGGAPYILFSFLGLLTWNFFSSAVSAGAGSILGNVSLLNKVACPREIFPITGMATTAVDAVISLFAVLGLFIITGYAPRGAAVWVPLYLVVQIAFTLGVVLIVSIVVVFLRDLRHALGIVLQLGLFATPVVYGLDVIPPNLRTLYVSVNPLAAVIDGYRRTVLFGQSPDWGYLGAASLTSGVVLLFGYWLFKRLETGVADVV